MSDTIANSSAEMKQADLRDAITTYCGVVQPWECDRNNHWNARFYVRAFQMASEAYSVAIRGINSGVETASFRHVRFHRELFVAAAVKVRSARIAQGPLAGAVLHWLESGGRLRATAIDQPGYDIDNGPRWSDIDETLASPRGLSGDPHLAQPAVAAGSGGNSAIGIVRPADIDHAGGLIMDNAFSFCTSSSYDLLDSFGFSPSWTAETGLSRMAVELKITRHGTCRAGDALSAHSYISTVNEKSFAVRHELGLLNGQGAILTAEQFLVVANLNTRKAVSIPEDLRGRLSAARAAG